MATFTITRNFPSPQSLPDAAGATPGRFSDYIDFPLYGSLQSVSVSLIDLSHTWPGDLDMMLVAPDGQNLVFLSDAGSSTDLVNADLTFSDDGGSAASNVTALVDGATYRPTSYGNEETDSTFNTTLGPLNHAGPAGGATFDSTFVWPGANSNGAWHLYIADGVASDTGSLGGWSLRIGMAGSGANVTGSSGNDRYELLPATATTGAFIRNGQTVSYSDVSTIVFDGGEGADTLHVRNGLPFYFIGGGGTDELHLVGSSLHTVVDLRLSNLSSVEQLFLGDPGGGGSMLVQIGADQFGTGLTSNATLSATGFADVLDRFEIYMGGASSLDLSGVTFANLSTTTDVHDSVSIFGDADAEIIRGSNTADWINAGTGVDQIFGGGGDDVITWDAADDLANIQGDGGFDTLYFRNSAAPVAFNLFTHGFEQAQGATSDSSSEPWSLNLWTYDQAWRAIRQDLTMDDGSKLVNAYTVTGVLDWTEDYNGLGDRIRFTNFDEGDIEGWSSYYDLFAYDAYWTTYLRTQRFVDYDNGASQREGFDDLGNVLWRQEYDATDTLIRYTEYDVPDSLDWTSYYNLYSAGARTQQYMTFDDGTSIRNGFDALGRLDWVQEYRTNGNLSRYVDYDQAGDQTWIYAVTYYDINGNQTSRYILYDDSSELYL